MQVMSHFDPGLVLQTSLLSASCLNIKKEIIVRWCWVPGDG